MPDFAPLLERPAWQRDAACQEHPSSWFFPPKGTNNIDAARLVCRRCLVRDECLEFAVAGGADIKGVWAGTTEAQRLRKLRRAA